MKSLCIILSSTRHPNVLRLYGWFYDDGHIYLVLEYCAKGELFKLLQKHERFPQAAAAWVCLHGRVGKGFKSIVSPLLRLSWWYLHYSREVPPFEFGSPFVHVVIDWWSSSALLPLSITFDFAWFKCGNAALAS